MGVRQVKLVKTHAWNLGIARKHVNWYHARVDAKLGHVNLHARLVNVNRLKRTQMHNWRDRT